MTRTCTLCEELANCNRKKPLIPHDTTTGPWKRLGTDRFGVNWKHFPLIIYVTTSHSTPSSHPYTLPQAKSLRRKSGKRRHSSADPTKLSATTNHNMSGNHSRTLSTNGASNTPLHLPVPIVRWVHRNIGADHQEDHQEMQQREQGHPHGHA